jgi:hypothetical protein
MMWPFTKKPSHVVAYTEEQLTIVITALQEEEKFIASLRRPVDDEHLWRRLVFLGTSISRLQVLLSEKRTARKLEEIINGAKQTDEAPSPPIMDSPGG